MHSCLLPTPLRPGDLLHVICPSGALRETELTRFWQGVEVWRSRSYRVEVPPALERRWGYLAGTDAERRSQLEVAWNHPEVRGILCARGGYGGARLLELQPSLGPTPKWLIGFSDITSLLWGLSLRGISGVHAAVLTTLAAEPEWSQQRLFDWVEGRSLPPLQGKGWGTGVAKGVLLPANLTVATHLLFTPAQPPLQDTILALEDVSEEPYRIDRMLTQWRTSGALQQVKGIALGRFSQCDPKLPNSFTVEEVLRDRLSDLQIPIVSHLPFGHDGPNAALPVGIPVTLDANQGQLSFHPAVPA